MRAGNLRHIIDIEQPFEGKTDTGGVSTTWEFFARTYAAIWPIKAAERLDLMKLGMTVTHKIRIRYLEGITPNKRIKFKSRVFNIISIINPDEKNRLLDLVCTEEI